MNANAKWREVIDSFMEEIGFMRYDFETKKIFRMMWIKGTTNLSDPLTKRDSPLITSLQLLLHSAMIPINFDANLSSNSSTG